MTSISEIRLSRRQLIATIGGGLGAAALSACDIVSPPAKPTPQVVEKVVTQIVEKQVVVTPGNTIISESGRSFITVTPAEARPAQAAATRTAEATVASAKPAEAVIGCPPAEQLGPWAPSASGEGETFEFTNHRNMLHMSLWWPSGKNSKGEALPWGDAEVSVTLKTRGKSYEAINGAGTGWDYPAECSVAEFDRQVAAYRGPDRPPYTNLHGGVEVEELIRLGVVRERVVRARTAAATGTVVPVGTLRPEATRPAATGTPGAVTTEAGACVFPKHEVLAKPGNHSIEAKDGEVVGSFWWNADNVDGGKEVRVRLPKSEKPYELVGGAGSVWKYTAGCSSEAVQKELEDSARKSGFKVVTVEELKTAGVITHAVK